MSLSFQEPEEEIRLAPSEQRTFSVKVEPPGVHRVHFGLLTQTQEQLLNDALLDRTSVVTDDNGIGYVQLTAPSTASRVFFVQASVGSVASDLLRIVVGKGYTRVQVLPKYTGKRVVEEWVATALTALTCEQLSLPPPDGALQAIAPYSDYSDQSSIAFLPMIEGVPVGGTIAITARAGGFASGCTTVSQLSANELTTVTVHVKDHPMRLEETDLLVSLGITQTSGRFQTVLSAASDAALDAFVDGAENDGLLLLDAMEQLISEPADADAFNASSQANDYSNRIIEVLGGRFELRDQMAAWLEQAEALIVSDSTLHGSLTGSAGGGTELELDSVAGVPASRAGFSTRVLSTWTADPKDIVALGAALQFLDTRFVTALAERAALFSFPETSDLPEALAESIACDEIGSALAADGPAFESYPGCGSDCTRSLCESALSELWRKIRAAEGAMHSLQVSASGEAKVDDQAVPIAFSGKWVATLDQNFASAISGPASGTQAILR